MHAVSVFVEGILEVEVEELVTLFEVVRVVVDDDIDDDINDAIWLASDVVNDDDGDDAALDSLIFFELVSKW